MPVTINRWSGAAHSQNSLPKYRAFSARLCAPQFVIGAALLANFLAGCEQAAPSLAKSTASQPAAEQTVRVVKPERKTILHPIEQPGFNIEPFQETAVYARVTGYVQKWYVDIGDPVKEGQVLAVLNVPEMVVDLGQKEAAIRQAAAQVEQAKAAILTAEAQLRRSQSQYERLKRVGKSGVIDQESVDETRLGFEAAQASVVKAKADETAAEARLEVAKANRDYSQTMLQYTEIRAPYQGVVTRRNISAGDFVQPATNVGARQALFVLSQIDPVRVFVNIPGSDAPWIKDGDPVTLQVQGAGGERLHGTITRNSRSLDPQSRTLHTEIDLPNPDGKLLPGMYVQARIVVQHANVWTIPEAAVLTEGNQAICYRVEKGKAIRTPLQIGLDGGGLVEVLKLQKTADSPLAEGQWTPITGNQQIVLSSATPLTNGQPVRATEGEK
jgi:RND family efflux transporter MFP subunit